MRPDRAGAVPIGASEAELAIAIAAGKFDTTPTELHDLLASAVAARLTVANPKYLQNP